MSSPDAPVPTAAEIAEARRLLEDVAVPTPLEESRWLSRIAGGPVYFKAENLQRAGSFKIRGAYVRMTRLTDEEKARGVVAASAGNHAQGVALAAQMLGIKAVVYMPHGAPIPKLKATRGYGAEVRFHGSTVDQALQEAKAYADATGAVLVHPFDHEDIVLGQATCGAEILEQCPEVRTLVVPTGGGGLLAGIAAAVKPTRPDVHLVGVQAEGAAAYPPSLREGSPTALESMSTMADGIAIGRPGDVPFRTVLSLVDEVVTVSEDRLSWALLMLLERAKLVVEPAGGAGVAAVLDRSERIGGEPFETPAVVVLSGGNIDPLLLMNVIRHGLAASGRYLGCTVVIPDRPGGLAALLAVIAETGANVIDLRHERTSAFLHIGEVDVAVQLETKGAEHAADVLAHLRAAGYGVREEAGSAGVGLGAGDRDRDLLAGRALEVDLVADLALVDRRAHRGLGGVDLEVVVDVVGHLAGAEEEGLLVARGELDGDDHAGLDHAVVVPVACRQAARRGCPGGRTRRLLDVWPQGQHHRHDAAGAAVQPLPQLPGSRQLLRRRPGIPAPDRALPVRSVQRAGPA